VTVLCYHSVESSWVSPLSVDPPEFDRHCAWLRRHRRTVDLPDALPALTRKGRLPRGTAALTFDDGFAALYEHALPVLREHRLPATVFVVARTLVDDRPMDWIHPDPAVPQHALSREQILAMREAGVRFGSHSLAHQDLTTLTEDECLRDLRESREILEDLLGEPVRLLAYPYGRHAEHVRRAARLAGYEFALSLPERREAAGPYTVPRAGIYRGNSTATLRLKASPWYIAWRTGPFYRVLGRLRRTATPMPNA
jgi:peptidoglycan/xylan/chitin deacetylase (PgdA/CDA1 family)